MATFSEVIRSAYQFKPDQVIITLQQAGVPDRPITYKDLVEGAAGYTKTFAQQGIQPGEVVILILQHGVDLLVGQRAQIAVREQAVAGGHDAEEVAQLRARLVHLALEVGQLLLEPIAVAAEPKQRTLAVLHALPLHMDATHEPVHTVVPKLSRVAA